MEQILHTQNRLDALKQQLEALDRNCLALKDALTIARNKAIEIKFQLNALDRPGFFQRHFGNLRKKKEETWQAYREAVAAQDQIQMDYDDLTARRNALQAEYQNLLAAENTAL